MKIKTKQTMAVILSVIASAGTVTTAFLTRKAAIKEEKIHQDGVSGKLNDEPTKKEFIKKYALKLYIPAIITGTATIAATISSTILSRKTEASLTAMALLADQGWRKYKGQVKNKLGLDTHSDILKSIGKKEYKKFKEAEENDGKDLYFEDHIGFFRADPEKFALAFSDINQRLQLEDYGVSSHYTMLYDLIKGCEADVLDKNLKPEAFRWGWSAEYLKETYGYIWVHLNIFDTVTESGKEFKTIVWGEDPFLDPGNFGEVFLYENRTKETNQFISAIPKKQEAVVDYELE